MRRASSFLAGCLSLLLYLSIHLHKRSFLSGHMCTMDSNDKRMWIHVDELHILCVLAALITGTIMIKEQPSISAVADSTELAIRQS